MTETTNPNRTASCHCGAVLIEIRDLPASLTECNCSICRRYGARWAYFPRNQVRMSAAAGALGAYSWGDRTIEFYHCRTCGCLTHHESVEKHGGSRFAVNARMLPPAATSGIRVRKFDGADTWKFLD